VNLRKHHVAAALAVLALLVIPVVFVPAVAAAEAPDLTLKAAPATIVYGDSARLTARVEVPGALLTLSRRYADAAGFTVVGTATADASGRAAWTLRPSGDVTYRAEFAGDATWAPASAEVVVGVRPRVKLRAGAVKPILEGRRITFSVAVRPLHPGGTVQLQRWSKDGWVLLKELTLNDASTARYTWRADQSGMLAVRANMQPDVDHRSGHSVPWKTEVFDPNNPYGVPSGYAHLIVVDLSQYRLYYHEHGQVVRVFDCVLGRPGLPTPRGHFRIYAKDPNIGGPYGPRRMRYLGAYAIHGTNEPWLLQRYPRNFSHGCTRLSNTNILWLYSRVPVGTRVWNVP